jgi:hypothetical protein
MSAEDKLSVFTFPTRASFHPQRVFFVCPFLLSLCYLTSVQATASYGSEIGGVSFSRKEHLEERQIPLFTCIDDFSKS